MKSTIAIANDHAAVALKHKIVAFLEEKGFAVLDLGSHNDEAVDYPDQAVALCNALGEGRAGQGILMCGSGIGMSISANRFLHIRAALCYSPEAARLSRAHNDANVLVLSSRLVGDAENLQMVDVFLTADFEGGRHQNRVDKMNKLGETA